MGLCQLTEWSTPIAGARAPVNRDFEEDAREGSWNEFTFAYVIIQDNSKETATVWLASFITQEQVDWGGLMAGATMLSIPIVILFLLVQRHFATGLTAGAVKG